MASARSGSSSRSSASSARDGAGGDEISWSPVAYREGPMDYEQAVYCKCNRKAPRWISWSIRNPGRRYYACMRRQAGGCDFWQWYDGDSTSPFVKQLLIDLRDKVWALAKENGKLRDSIYEAKAQIDQQLVQRARLEQMLVQRVEGSDWRRALAEKEEQVVALSDKVKKFEKERLFLLSALFGCGCLVLGMMIK
ncbi:unnamed protein product [Urochloa humidicola]